MKKHNTESDTNTPQKPKHAMFREILLANIVDKGIWSPGEKIPPERDLQIQYGISRNTVRKAISDLVDDGYLFSEVGRGTFVNSASLWGSSKKLLKSKLIGLIITDVKHDFGKKVVKGAEDLLHKRGYALVLCQDNYDISKTNKYIAMLMDSDVRGIILDPVLSSNFVADNRRLVEKLDAGGIPVVLIDRDIPTVKKNLVSTNNQEITCKAAEYLIDNGHTSILVVRQDGFMMDTRIRGIEDAYERRGIPRGRLKTINIRPSDDLGADIGLVAEKIAATGKSATAVISLSEYLGKVTYRALDKLKKRIPDDISFITFDHPEDSSFEEGKITFIEQPAVQMGHKAADMIVNLIESRGQEVVTVRLKSKLVVRRSVITLPT